MLVSNTGCGETLPTETNSDQGNDNIKSPLTLIILIGLAIGIILNAGITQSPITTQKNIEFYIIDVTPVGFDYKGTPISFVVDFMIKNNGLLHVTLEESTLNFILIDPNQKMTLMDYSSFPELIELKKDEYITKQIQVNLNSRIVDNLKKDIVNSTNIVNPFEGFKVRYQLISSANYLFQTKIISLNYDFSWESFNNITK